MSAPAWGASARSPTPPWGSTGRSGAGTASGARATRVLPPGGPRGTGARLGGPRTRGLAAGGAGGAPAPPAPETVPAEERDEAERAWWHHWAAGSPDLHAYLAELAEIESLSVQGDVAVGKMSMLKEKQRRSAQLQKRWGCPEPPWRAVSANLVWNIHNTPASQISMLGRITGLAFAPVGACSTFGLALKLALDAIDRGEAKAVVVGATDPPPHP